MRNASPQIEPASDLMQRLTQADEELKAIRSEVASLDGEDSQEIHEALTSTAYRMWINTMGILQGTAEKETPEPNDNATPQEDEPSATPENAMDLLEAIEDHAQEMSRFLDAHWDKLRLLAKLLRTGITEDDRVDNAVQTAQSIASLLDDVAESLVCKLETTDTHLFRSMEKCLESLIPSREDGEMISETV